MESIIKTTHLTNSWETFTTSKTTNTIDVSCISDVSDNMVSLNDVPLLMANHNTRDEVKNLNIGYNTTYKLTGQDGGSGSVYCTIREYTSSKTVDFAMNGDLFFIFMVGFYIFFFAL